MLKRIVNHARIDLQIIPLDPLLIKSGQATVGGVDMSFVRTYRFGEEDQPFIPGSSLKGVFRSYAEKICRSLREDAVPVCLPYVEPGKEQDGEKNQASCGLQFERYKKDRNGNAIPTPDVYRLSCPVCRLFGSHGFIGRFAASDAYLSKKENKTVKYSFEIRDGVAIDRFTGGVAQGPFDLEVLSQGDFSTSLEIRNFERWQLGLVGLVLRDMEEGFVRIGFGKSRGLGRIKAAVTRFTISYYNRDVKTLLGLFGLCSEPECKSYGFYLEGTSRAAFWPAPLINGIRRDHDVTERWKEVLAPAVDDLVGYVGAVNWPQALMQYTERRA